MTSRSEDDPLAVREAEWREREMVLRRAHEQDMAEMRDEFGAMMAELKGRAAVATEPPAKSAAAPFEIKAKIHDWKGLLGFVTGILGFAFGLWNSIDKAPDPELDALKKLVAVQGAEIKARDEDLDKTKRMVTPLPKFRCAEQRYWAAILSKIKPPILVKVQNCKDGESPIKFEENSFPQGKNKAIVVETPMPIPEWPGE